MRYTGEVTRSVSGEPEQVAASATPLRRPGPLRWLRYALGGRLPQRFSPWVLHDTSTGTWFLRHVARTMVQLAIPIGLVLLLVPGEFWIRGMAALGGILLALIYSVAYVTEFLENRVVKAGYPVGSAQAARDRYAREREVHESRRRREAAARRAERYRERQGH
jgi:Family of unknown function (DUF5313)